MPLDCKQPDCKSTGLQGLHRLHEYRIARTTWTSCCMLGNIFLTAWWPTRGRRIYIYIYIKLRGRPPCLEKYKAKLHSACDPNSERIPTGRRECWPVFTLFSFEVWLHRTRFWDIFAIFGSILREKSSPGPIWRHR